ncbi:MAG: Do family serine endopeptidase [Ignavibacteriae bacterium]|nr:Do family serine endopeptidase [Ignavibacteriota bacterium]
MIDKKLFRTASLIGGGFIFGAVLVLFVFTSLGTNLIADGPAIGANKPPVVVSDQVKALNDAYVNVSNAVIPTVVSVSVIVENKDTGKMNEQFKDFFKFFGQPFGDDENPNFHKSEGSGSGVIISEDGYIVTNNHVVEDATEMTVTTNDKKEHKAKLIGRDPLTDLAVIKIEGSGFPVAHFGEIENVKVGEMVIAVGNPLGLNSTVTGGIVSAIGRGGLALGNDRSGYSVENFIQTDAAINPGNSGGGLYNLEGSLIGINSAIATRTGTYIGYGFAIPIDLVKAVIMDLIDDGKVNRGYIGVRIKTVDEVEAKSSGLDKVEGAMVHEVMKDQAAEKAGIEIGDIILEINGKQVKTSNELQSQIVLHRAGDVVNLTIWRDGRKINKSVKLLARDEDTGEEKTIAGDEPKKDEETNKPISFDKLGFSIGPLTSEVKKNNDVNKGVVVTKVDRYSKAAERGLAPNGVIVKADRKDVSSPEQLKKLIDSKKPGDAILLQLKYPDASRIVALEIPD